jgi:hypothetical protein
MYIIGGEAPKYEDVAFFMKKVGDLKQDLEKLKAALSPHDFEAKGKIDYLISELTKFKKHPSIAPIARQIQLTHLTTMERKLKDSTTYTEVEKQAMKLRIQNLKNQLQA